ncbi:sugar transferase [Tolypothrix sp. FACHB-123]|uniref:Npun_R2821/Npun_R2822 family protein n=1 Tax=Tolypothrix sp. FACHB-123 TaxID=2692868 RepID=UPI0016829536|nr:Npun_R2821/Npun_R2822 family protein [Tolypothrix sp. FACHB-123]MBD2359323.1 sugar transferase [Tolypothrix sp. FACHB-123]
MIDGIYTLANDIVYDQLVALLNSIDANAGRKIPVCVIPYNQQLDKVKAEIATRENVTLFADYTSISRWENFGSRIWQAHPRALKLWKEYGLSENYRLERHRKLCCLDGPFDKFIFFDGDTLLMKPLDDVYQKLDDYDWIANDYQYKSDLNYIFNWSEEKIENTFKLKNISKHIFCSGWFASKKGVFNEETLAKLLENLEAGEADVLAWADSDQTVMNYLVLRSGISYYNYAYHSQGTGCHWSSKFDVVDNILYDQGNPITYLHYMSVASSDFTRLCKGEDVDIPYRDVFLHYRYLKSPETRPKSFWRPSRFTQLQNQTKNFVQQKVSNFKLNYRNFKDKITRNSV